jgi:hypothetical protein
MRNQNEAPKVRCPINGNLPINPKHNVRHIQFHNPLKICGIHLESLFFYDVPPELKYIVVQNQFVWG